MTTAERSVLQTEDGMQVQARLAIVTLRHLALFIDIDRLVSLCNKIEPAHSRFRERADRRHGSTGDFLAIGKLGDGLEGLFSMIENEDKSSLDAVLKRLRFDRLFRADALFAARQPDL
jgi:hypothetical protein